MPPGKLDNATGSRLSRVMSTEPSTLPLTRSCPALANATVLTAAACVMVRISLPSGSAYISTVLPRAIAARSPAAETVGNANWSPSTCVTLGNSASNLPRTVSQT